MRLPEEILLRIFEACLSWPPHPDHYAFNVKLMGVCFRWFTLGKTAPSLWSYLTNLRSEASAARALERSGNTPLDVEFCFGSGRRKCNDASFGRLLRDNIKRLRYMRLEIHAENVLDEVNRLFELSVPNLESLEMLFRPSDYTSLATFIMSAPRLREFTSEKTNIPWSILSLRNLTYLEVNFARKSGTRLKHVLAVIKASPSLETIDFDQFNIVPTKSKSVATHLPFLRTLHLHGMDATIIDQLVGAIDAPNCRDLSLDSMITYTTTTDLFKALPKWVDSYVAEAFVQSFTRFGFGQGFLLIDISGPNRDAPPPDAYKTTPKLRIMLCVSSYLHVVDSLVGMSLDTSTSIAVTIRQHLDIDHEEPSFLMSVFRLASITSISLNTVHNLEGFFAHLATQQKSFGPQSTWPYPLPKLRKLELERTTLKAIHLIEMVTRRYGRLKTKATGNKRAASKAISKPLQLFIGKEGIADMTDERVRRLKEIVGEDNVIWNPLHNAGMPYSLW